MSDKNLLKLREMWNESHPSKKIVSTSPAEIWQEMRKLYPKCKHEMCWLHNLSAPREIEDQYAPLAPKSWLHNPNEWLSNIDILEVMDRYETKYPYFDFLGPAPIDFDSPSGGSSKCVTDELCAFDLEQKMKEKKRKIGVIFNTDPHDKGGQHWIGLYIDIQGARIYFFDSAGDAILPEIKVFVDRICAQFKKMGKRCVFEENAPLVHQYKNTECGMYSLFFIIEMLLGRNFKQTFCNKRIPDEKIAELRKVLFNVV